MSFFDQILSDVTATGGAAATPHAGVAQALLGMLADGQAGGVAGLLQAFEQGGLGQVAASWVGNGQNLPVTADQIRGVLGSDRIQELAQKAGIPPEEASQAIAAVLPGLVDKLTPGGQVDSGLLDEGLGMLKKFL
jgi:uncharacterized protein YidB (DUF937 family)